MSGMYFYMLIGTLFIIGAEIKENTVLRILGAMYFLVALFDAIINLL